LAFSSKSSPSGITESPLYLWAGSSIISVISFFEIALEGEISLT